MELLITIYRDTADLNLLMCKFYLDVTINIFRAVNKFKFLSVL